MLDFPNSSVIYYNRWERSRWNRKNRTTRPSIPSTSFRLPQDFKTLNVNGNIVSTFKQCREYPQKSKQNFGMVKLISLVQIVLN